MHPDFRLFMCMNPPYTSAGKKQLPQSLRGKVTEVYVPELDNESDLWEIIDKITKLQKGISESEKRSILKFYLTIKTEVQQ